MLFKTRPVRLNLAFSRFCSSKSNSKKWSSTVYLPKTTFPQRLEGDKRIQTDKEIILSSKFQSVYERQRSHQLEQEWMLHDGPPYANGPVHMGHAVNKILKDITNRWKVVLGHRVHYVPGWDCHGLPIELKALQAGKSKSREKDPVKIRTMARNFALTAIESQKSEFISWGVMADWSKPYLTMNKDFVQAQLRLFHDLMSKGFIYQRFMPVYWSPSSETALAESELEYNPKHVSTAIYVRFPILDESLSKLQMSESYKGGKLYFLSWTTTPWSLAANRAIAFKDDAEYVIVQLEQDFYIVSGVLLSSNSELQEIFSSEPKIIETLSGTELSHFKYSHPLSPRTRLPLLPGSHVTLDAGTGLVHTAPAHGPEDYLLGIKHELDLSCSVNEQGKYDVTVSATIHPDLEGLEVLSDGNQAIIKMLDDGGHLLKKTDFEHSYPYDWRTKKPVILRASRQWFMDTRSLQSRALELVSSKVSIAPSSMTPGFEGVLKTRPYWCISRQRVWGVPIPVFYDENEQAVTSAELIEKLCELTEKHGNVDFWWSMPKHELLKTLGFSTTTNLSKGNDILDVWFDSGMSWNAVLPKHDCKKQKADLYLEGLDQFSGWFYSSLLTSIGAQEDSPYKSIFVHGFTLDEKGRKMSKSLGNVIAPCQITQGIKPNGKIGTIFGVDVLRYWVGAHACQSSSIPVGEDLMKQTKQEVDRLRNALRYIIGNINDEATKKDIFALPYHEMTLVDQYMLHILWKYRSTLTDCFETMAFNQVCQVTQNFVANDLSSFYFMLVKDRLYCDAQESLGRKSAVTVMLKLGQYMTKLLSPIVPVLIEEIAQHCPELGIDLAEKLEDVSDEWRNDALYEDFQVILEVKSALNQMKVKKNNIVTIQSHPKLAGMFNPQDLTEIWQVAEVIFTDILEKSNLRAGNISLNITETKKSSCPRCRLFQSDKEEELCPRCQNVILSDWTHN